MSAYQDFAVELVELLGLPSKHLIEFTIKVTGHSFPTVIAIYEVPCIVKGVPSVEVLRRRFSVSVSERS